MDSACARACVTPFLETSGRAAVTVIPLIKLRISRVARRVVPSNIGNLLQAVTLIAGGGTSRASWSVQPGCSVIPLTFMNQRLDRAGRGLIKYQRQL